MADFDFFDIIKKCCLELQVLDEPTTFADTEETEYKKLKGTINAINREIVLMEAERWTFRETETTVTIVAGQTDYARPNGVITSIHLEGVARPLIPEYAWNYLYTKTGRPDRYNIYGDKLQIYPIPSDLYNGKTLTIKHATNQCATDVNGVLKDNMDLSTDKSIIPAIYSNALIYGACRDYKGMPDRSRYQHFNTRFTSSIRQMRSQMKRTNEFVPYVDIGERKNGGVDDIISEFFHPWI